MSENEHDWAARRHQQDAGNLWASEGGSVNHWNAYHDAQRSQQLADEQRASDASARAAANATTSSTPYAFAPTSYPVGTGSFAPAGRSRPLDDSQIGLILWKLTQWTVLPLLAVVVFVSAGWYGVHAADGAWTKSDPQGGLTRYATARVFPGEALAPVSAYLAAKDRANVLQGPALIAALRTVKRPMAVGDARNARLLSSAYACQATIDCRASLAQDAPDLQIELLDRAVSFLGHKAKAGSEPAARDGCLLPLLTGTTPAAVFWGRNACALMVAANPKSVEAREHLFQLENSGWFKLARIVAAEPWAR